MHRFPDTYRAFGCQAVGEGFGKDRRHMLHDQEGHTDVPGNGWQQLRQRDRAAGGNADQNHFRLLGI